MNAAAKPLEIGVEISLYPLDADYVPPIKGFIARLNADPTLLMVRAEALGLGGLRRSLLIVLRRGELGTEVASWREMR